MIVLGIEIPDSVLVILINAMLSIVVSVIVSLIAVRDKANTYHTHDFPHTHTDIRELSNRIKAIEDKPTCLPTYLP